MEMRQIVIPLDGSSASRFALSTGLALAHAARARVQLVHVFQPIPPPMEGLARLPTRDEARSYVEKIAAEASEMSHVPTTAEVIDARFPADALLAHARTLPADLLVMATHGRGGVSRFWIGSVADTVMRQADLPILLVRSRKGPPPDMAVGDLFRHLLIPLDGSPDAEAALEPAMTLGGLGSAQLTLVRVVPAHMPLPLIEDPGSVASAVQKEAAEGARHYLTEVARRLEARGITTHAVLSRAQHVAGAIKRVASNEGADLIVISSHGLGGARRALLGSTTDKVVRTASVPVLVVHPRPSHGAGS